MQTLPINGVKAGAFCILGSKLCRQAKVAPFVFTFMIQEGSFIIWVSFLLLVQTWQIAKNKTTNEVSNWYRLEYFNPDTTSTDDDLDEMGEEEERGMKHVHGPVCNHEKSKKIVNPFDKGTLLNCTEFCWGHTDNMYYELHSVPINEPPVAVIAAEPIPKLKTDTSGRHIV